MAQVICFQLLREGLPGKRYITAAEKTCQGWMVMVSLGQMISPASSNTVMHSDAAMYYYYYAL